MKTFVGLVSSLVLAGALAGCGDDSSSGSGGGGGGDTTSTSDSSSTGTPTTAQGSPTGSGTPSSSSDTSSSTGEGTGTSNSSASSGEGGATSSSSSSSGETSSSSSGEGGGAAVEVELPQEISGTGDPEQLAFIGLGELVTELGDPSLPDLVQIEVWDDGTPGTQELDSEVNQSELYQRAVFIGVDVVEEVDDEGNTVLTPSAFYVGVRGSFTLGENDIFNASGDIQLSNVVLDLTTDAGLDPSDELTIGEAAITVLAAE